MTEDAFLAALEADPADAVTARAWADWLDERGQPHRAAALRWLVARGKYPLRAQRDGHECWLWHSHQGPGVGACLSTQGFFRGSTVHPRADDDYRHGHLPCSVVRAVSTLLVDRTYVTDASYRRLMERTLDELEFHFDVAHFVTYRG